MQDAKTTASNPLTFLCLASFEKGHRFLEEARRQGCRVLLLTSQSLEHTAEWPRDALDDIFYMPDQDNEWNLQDMLLAVSHLSRTRQIDRVIPLDDFDLEKAALLREHLRLPGLGETSTRYFRDKLAMRTRAAEAGLPVPEFTGAINYERISRFLERVPPPWILKPRLMAGAIGIKKFEHAHDVWEKIHSLVDQQSFFVLERFIPGDILHVDSIWWRGEPVFAIASAYGTPPLEVSHEGGIFTTRTLDDDSELARSAKSLNERVLKAFGLREGVSHTEFIRCRSTGSLYFLETSARVGGANISDLIEVATGINMWTEWSRLEIASALGRTYTLPIAEKYYAGLLVSLSRHEWPDASRFMEPEIVWRLRKRHHVGLIFKSHDQSRIGDLLNAYTDRIRHEYHASAPAREKAHQ